MAPILRVEPGENSEERELEFELAYQRSLTVQERFDLMFRKSRELAELLWKHGY